MRSGRISSKGRLRVSEDRLGDGESGSARRSAWEPDVPCRAEGGLAALPIERRSVGRATHRSAAFRGFTKLAPPVAHCA